MELPLIQVDAFTSRLFAGNPAAVVPLEAWLDDELLQAIALENNLSETAFLVPTDEPDTDFHLRWFTPAIEVGLCGHATLATGHALFHHLGFSGDRARFQSLSGPLAVERDGDRLWLDFPAAGRRPVESAHVVDQLSEALGARPVEVYLIREGLKGGHLAVFEDESDVLGLTPDFKSLRGIGAGFAVATAPVSGGEHDFASRVFAPGAGIDEDPVTGAAHCVLTPYWAERLDRNELRARQVSSRGGELLCELRADRVRLGGHAVTYLVGTIRVS